MLRKCLRMQCIAHDWTAEPRDARLSSSWIVIQGGRDAEP
jgi:hypothetical protein